MTNHDVTLYMAVFFLCFYVVLRANPSSSFLLRDRWSLLYLRHVRNFCSVLSFFFFFFFIFETRSVSNRSSFSIKCFSSTFQ